MDKSAGTSFKAVFLIVNSGLFGQQLNARSISVTGNAGYNIPLHSNWFIEPSAGVIWSHVNIDQLNVAGVLQTGAPNAPYARGTVNIDDVDSVLGRATLRVGTTFTHAGVAYPAVCHGQRFSRVRR